MPYKDPEQQRRYQREWARKHRGRQTAYLQEYRKKIRHTLLQWIVNLKKTLSCEACGENRWYCLDFHHKRDKKDCISKMIQDRQSKELILKEIEKCIVLCANCHREVHHNESSHG